ncbi:hypothetical protein RMR10_011965 [Agrobacterium rosae]|uniref:hypothetical protein n=1 Tax=Agrobacterium rosae TaxID=1972867 RepID=UPI002A180FFB|nr:hypothetical protein [Agrobacterium rosae]MDX8313344.1 hypothetical protein [Agrobacterium rosae]
MHKFLDLDTGDIVEAWVFDPAQRLSPSLPDFARAAFQENVVDLKSHGWIIDSEHLGGILRGSDEKAKRVADGRENTIDAGDYLVKDDLGKFHIYHADIFALCFRPVDLTKFKLEEGNGLVVIDAWVFSPYSISRPELPLFMKEAIETGAIRQIGNEWIFQDMKARPGVQKLVTGAVILKTVDSNLLRVESNREFRKNYVPVTVGVDLAGNGSEESA